MRYENIIPATLNDLIIALCADFSRRSEVMRANAMPHRVIMEYRYLNYRMYNAAIEIAGSRDAKIFIDDIGARRGYAKSEASHLSETTYKIRKMQVKINIAKRLCLTD